MFLRKCCLTLSIIHYLTMTQRIHHWLHATRSSRRDDAVQDIRLHYHGPGTLLRPRPQTRPIHENPPPIHVHGPNDRHSLGLYRPSRRPRMGPRRRNRRHLHRTPSQQIQLSQRPRLFQRLRHLGPDRSPARLLPRKHLRQPPVVLARRHPRPHPNLPPRAHIPQNAVQISLRPPHLRRQRPNPARYAAQLSHLGSGGLYFQQVHSKQVPKLVDAV